MIRPQLLSLRPQRGAGTGVSRTGNVAWAALAGSYLALSACAPVLPFTLAGPPAVLAEASHAGVGDRRGRFREIFCAIAAREPDLQNMRPCEEALHRFGAEPGATGQPVPLGQSKGNVRVVIVPGIFGECVRHISEPFQDAAAHLRTHGYRVGILEVEGRSSSAKNAGKIRDELAKLQLAPTERLILIGYSKGTSDIIETLSRFPGAIPAGSALVSVAGVVAGTPIADKGEGVYDRLLKNLRLKRCQPGDKGGVQSLTRRDRLEWLRAHPLPPDYSYFSLPAVTTADNISRALMPTRKMLDRIDAHNDG